MLVKCSRVSELGCPDHNHCCLQPIACVPPCHVKLSPLSAEYVQHGTQHLCKRHHHCPPEPSHCRVLRQFCSQQLQLHPGATCVVCYPRCTGQSHILRLQRCESSSPSHPPQPPSSPSCSTLSIIQNCTCRHRLGACSGSLCLPGRFFGLAYCARTTSVSMWLWRKRMGNAPWRVCGGLGWVVRCFLPKGTTFILKTFLVRTLFIRSLWIRRFNMF